MGITMNHTAGLGKSLAQPRSKRKKNKKNKVFKNVMLVNVFLILLIVAIALLTPAFYVHEITVTGTAQLTPDKVIDASGLEVGRNIFTFRTSTVEENIKELSFVKEAKVHRQFPDKLSVIITECKPMAQVVCGESLYIVVDDQGKILDTTSESAKYGVPVIEGLFVEQFEVGTLITTSEAEKFDQLLSLSKELSENNLIDRITKIALQKSNIYLTFQQGVVCDIGNGKNSSYKIRFLKEVIEQIPQGKTGTVEFIDEYKAVFKEDE